MSDAKQGMEPQGPSGDDWRQGRTTLQDQNLYMLEQGLFCDVTFTVGSEDGETKVSDPRPWEQYSNLNYSAILFFKSINFGHI